MIESANPEINVEELMQCIRQEVAQRKAQLPSASASPAVNVPYSPMATAPRTPYVPTSLALPRLPESKDCIAPKPDYTLAELLNYEDDLFVRSAYIAVLRRAPEAGGSRTASLCCVPGSAPKPKFWAACATRPKAKPAPSQCAGAVACHHPQRSTLTRKMVASNGQFAISKSGREHTLVMLNIFETCHFLRVWHRT